MAVSHLFSLLAQQPAGENPLRYFAEEFQQRGSRIDPDAFMRGLGIAIVVLIVFWLLLRLVPWKRMPWSPQGSLGLFWSLCRAHRLSWADRWLLWQIARRQRLRHPARVFLEPERLEPSATGWLSPIQLARLESLSWNLFGDNSPAGQAALHLGAEATGISPSGAPPLAVTAGEQSPTPSVEPPQWPVVDQLPDGFPPSEEHAPPAAKR